MCLGIATVHFRVQSNLQYILCNAFLNSFLQITSISTHIWHSSIPQCIYFQVSHQCMCCTCSNAQRSGTKLFSPVQCLHIGHCFSPQAMHFLHNILRKVGYNFESCYVTFLLRTFLKFNSPPNWIHQSRKGSWPVTNQEDADLFPGSATPTALPHHPHLVSPHNLTLCKCTVEKSHTNVMRSWFKSDQIINLGTLNLRTHLKAHKAEKSQTKAASHNKASLCN